MPGLTRLSRNRKLLLAAGVTVVVGALVVALAILRPWAPSQKEAADVAPPAAGDRVLQSVSLAMQSDGSLNQIGDTVVVSRGESGASDTYNTSYDPSKVVDELPVRVVSSYRTDHSSGTDLADLTGFTGRVTIDLAVQNLTVQPQQVSYDAGGRSHSTTAMVGAPLTVVASASLPEIDPATVVTAPKSGSSDADTTNGVLSRTADQGAQVQWATILAPPQLSATANLRLVLDAKDFVVPTVDLSVQPGLVTDPSVGALVDAAFNPKNSDELALESRTIGVIGDVNDVLTRASSQISKVRKTLDTTSKTLGTKTVLALQQDTKQIDTSLKQSDQNLDSLDKALQSSLKSTSSSTLESLASTVSQLDGLLGDTSAAPPQPTVSGAGCSSTVTPPKAGGSVYASLLQVTAQLEAYAKTTQDCKVELQQTILTTIGPAAPDDEACADDATSVTCSLNAVRSSFADITKDIEDRADDHDRARPGEEVRGQSGRSDLGVRSAGRDREADRRAAGRRRRRARAGSGPGHPGADRGDDCGRGRPEVPCRCQGRRRRHPHGSPGEQDQGRLHGRPEQRAGRESLPGHRRRHPTGHADRHPGRAVPVLPRHPVLPGRQRRDHPADAAGQVRSGHVDPAGGPGGRLDRRRGPDRHVGHQGGAGSAPHPGRRSARRTWRRRSRRQRTG